MKVVVTGAAGFIGRKLAHALLDRGELIGPKGTPETIDQLVLIDVVPAPAIDDRRVMSVVGEVGDPAVLDKVIGRNADTIFHLASVVSAGAEANFELGYRVNLDGMRALLELCRSAPGTPRLVFTSSIAVYGGDLPEVIDDTTIPCPQLSYGAQKLICETLVADYTRKGFIDGRSLRLPTVMVRTGKPNLAASTWASSIIREPLAGQDVVCPVEPRSFMACLSARKTVEALIHMHELPSVRTVQLPGIPVTAGEMVEAAMRQAGDRPTGKQQTGKRQTGEVIWEADPKIQGIVDGWPRETRSARAEALGFEPDGSIDDIVRAFVEDDLEDQLRHY